MRIDVRLLAGNEIECGQRAVAAVADEIDRKGEELVAAVLMEPDAGTNGIVAPENYWPGLRELTRSRNVFLIADEVMSGFGRCGEWFAWQRYGDAGKPDLMTLAKGLTGAHLPLGAVVVNENVARHLETQMLFTGLTYSGHPLTCAAGLAAIRAYEDEKLIERSRRLGSAMLLELKRLQRQHRLIGDVRGGHGLFAIVELVSDSDQPRTAGTLAANASATDALVQKARALGVSFAYAET
jgi:taurine--2-oxoglutarate transaminase